ncbi:helix-turn-helix domain-containing protein [Kitasatospora sp. NPDC001683]
MPEPEPQWENPLTAAAGNADDALVDPAGRVAERRRANHALAHRLLAGGMSQRAVAKHLGWSRNTVRRYAEAEKWQDMMKGPAGPAARQARPPEGGLVHQLSDGVVDEQEAVNRSPAGDLTCPTLATPQPTSQGHRSHRHWAQGGRR